MRKAEKGSAEGLTTERSERIGGATPRQTACEVGGVRSRSGQTALELDSPIVLPDEVVLELERLSYEVNGLKVLHTHALNAGLEKSKICEIRREFLDKNTEYRLAAQEVANAYGVKGRWHIDFAEGVLTVEA